MYYATKAISLANPCTHPTQTGRTCNAQPRYRCTDEACRAILCGKHVSRVDNGLKCSSCAARAAVMRRAA
jgi:hypothetical protein